MLDPETIDFKSMERAIRTYLGPRRINPVEVDEIVADTFVEILRKLHRFSGGSLNAWACSIARSVSIDRYRHEHGRRFKYPYIVPWEERFDKIGFESPDRSLIEKETADRLRTAVRRLPEKQRRVLELRFFAEKGLYETAEILGISHVTVLAREKQALKHLRGELGDKFAS